MIGNFEKMGDPQVGNGHCKCPLLPNSAPSKCVHKGLFLSLCKVCYFTLQGVCNKFNEQFKGLIFECSQLPDSPIQQPPTKQMSVPGSIAVTSASKLLPPARSATSASAADIHFGTTLLLEAAMERQKQTTACLHAIPGYTLALPFCALFVWQHDSNPLTFYLDH